MRLQGVLLAVSVCCRGGGGGEAEEGRENITHAAECDIYTTLPLSISTHPTVVKLSGNASASCTAAMANGGSCVERCFATHNTNTNTCPTQGDHILLIHKRDGNTTSDGVCYVSSLAQR